jgi:hypothetical protein
MGRRRGGTVLILLEEAHYILKWVIPFQDLANGDLFS